MIPCAWLSRTGYTSYHDMAGLGDGSQMEGQIKPTMIQGEIEFTCQNRAGSVRVAGWEPRTCNGR